MNAVYDFLYSDSRRIAAFLSQFTNLGNPNQVKIGESAVETAEDTSNNQVSGSLAVVSTKLQSQHKDSTTTNEARETIYDPLWKNALSFMEYLESKKLIHNDLTISRIGQFVRVSGELAILDLPMLRQLWELPIVRTTVLEGAPPTVAEALSAQQQHESRKDRKAKRRQQPIAENPKRR